VSAPGRLPVLPDMIPAWVDGTLAPVEKLEVHQRGLRHKAISAFVFHGGRLLIQRRALSKYHTPGLWANTCCTHPHWGEDAHTCATRRLDQELGLRGLVLEARGTVEYRADVGGGLTEHEVVDLFVATPESVPAVMPNPDEVAEVAWITPAELLADVAARPERYTPWLVIYLRDHAARIMAR
jgi:isopentenyl-diphosphate delta-isomerase